jgi:long-subunit fatty acid transport protein
LDYESSHTIREHWTIFRTITVFFFSQVSKFLVCSRNLEL